MPSEDTGQVFGTTQAQEGISFDDMKLHQAAITKVVRKDPDVVAVMSSVGAGSGNLAANQGL